MHRGNAGRFRPADLHAANEGMCPLGLFLHLLQVDCLILSIWVLILLLFSSMSHDCTSNHRILNKSLSCPIQYASATMVRAFKSKCAQMSHALLKGDVSVTAVQCGTLAP